jgi:hypothetical protein
VLTHPFGWPDALIPHHLGRCSALLEELARLEYPAVAVSLDLSVLDLPLRVPLGESEALSFPGRGAAY